MIRPCRFAVAALSLSLATALRQKGSLQGADDDADVDAGDDDDYDPNLVDMFAYRAEMATALSDVPGPVPKIKQRHPPDGSKKETLVIIDNAAVNAQGRIIKDGSFVPLIYHGCPYDLSVDGNDAAVPANAPHFKKIVALTQVWAGYYYFTIAEALTRLVHIRMHQRALVHQAMYHLGSNQRWAADWAWLAGLNRKIVVSGFATADVVVYPQSNPCAHVRTDFVRATRHFVHRRLPRWEGKHPMFVPPEAGKTMRAVLIRRANQRVIENEHDLKHLLNKNGFQVSILEEANLPMVPTQCHIFKCADLIVGAYSPVFTNLLCARRGTSVFEYHMADPNVEHFHMAQELNLQYHGIPTNATVKAKSWIVPMGETKHALRKLFRDRVWAQNHGQLLPDPMC